MRLLDLMTSLGLTVEEETSFPPYSVDVYLPELHVALEADGPTHQMSKDEKRDLQLLAEYALPVYRLTGEVLMKKRKEILSALLLEVLSKQWGSSVLERKQLAVSAGWDG